MRAAFPEIAERGAAMAVRWRKMSEIGLPVIRKPLLSRRRRFRKEQKRERGAGYCPMPRLPPQL